jgi:tetratricopeptide (TPR) repeat protein
LIELDTPEKAVLLKNKAAVYLKVSDYEAAIKDCTMSLEISPDDPKALFRRCQAHEALEKYEEAYKDARQVHNLDKKNKAIAPILKRLHDIVQDRVCFNHIFISF